MEMRVDWRVKGLIQKVLAALPGGSRLNSAMQLRMGGLRQFDRNVDTKVCDDWLVLASHMQELGIPIQGRVFVEVGSGWYPTLPVCFHLAGASRCLTFDLHRLMDWDLARRMLERLEQHLPRISTQLKIDEAVLRDRLVKLRQAGDMQDFLQRAGIEYHAPADATRTGMPDGSVDVVFSNSVLEHVPGPVIAELMRETRRVLAPGGIALHSVNCGDHYAYFDRSITQMNYLRYSAAQWWIWNNDLQYQNRLRADDFLQLAREAGLEVVLNHQRPRPELLQAFESFPVASEFRRYSREQLCTTSIDFVARTAS
jgi:SAM-dependent methyltransferase